MRAHLGMRRMRRLVTLQPGPGVLYVRTAVGLTERVLASVYLHTPLFLRAMCTCGRLRPPEFVKAAFVDT